MKDIKKIVILGGGSSGWMTAASLIKNFPDMDITLVESSDIPTIGVGESTINSINVFLRDLGIKDSDWMKHCNAVYKTSIDFTNWDGKGTRIRYPFGDSEFFDDYIPAEWFTKKALHGAPNDEFTAFAMGSDQMIRKNKLTKENKIRGWNFDYDTAYHMDAGLFGDYLKNHYCKPRGVKQKLANVTSVDVDDGGNVERLIFSSHSWDFIAADLYIDCSGFKSLLLNKTLGEPFISFKNKLHSDSAIAIRIPYVDKEIEMEHSTNATTLSSGWVWNTPLWDRIGTGYVYSSKFLNPSEAEHEFREYLINDRDIPHDRKEIESLKANHIDISPGIHERSWVKNVVGVGLSNGFIEPIEATGLMLTHDTIFSLIQTLQRRDCKVNGYDKDIHNQTVRKGMQKFTTFIALHYALAERDDTPYWKHVTEDMEYMDDHSAEWVGLIDYVPEKITNQQDWTGEVPRKNGVSFIMAGMGYNPISKMSVEMYYGKQNMHIPNTRSARLQELIDEEIIINKDYIDSLPSHYEFLKTTIYKEG